MVVCVRTCASFFSFFLIVIQKTIQAPKIKTYGYSSTEGYVKINLVKWFLSFSSIKIRLNAFKKIGVTDLLFEKNG